MLNYPAGRVVGVVLLRVRSSQPPMGPGGTILAISPLLFLPSLYSLR